MRSIAPTALLAACALPATPPLGEVMVIVDTDLQHVSRLRVDVFASDRRWPATRDISAFKPAAWPISFGVYLERDTATATEVLLRLRAYPEGKVRDYRGERFEAEPDDPTSTAVPVTTPSRWPAHGPFLASGATPKTEPQPLLTIDRLVRVRIEPGKVRAVRVLLRGTCAGTMADLANDRTCLNLEKERATVALEVLDEDLEVGTSQRGAFESARALGCTAPARPATTTADGTPLHDEEVCVKGGVYIFGDARQRTGETSAAVPERFAVIPPFLMDRFEVTVGRVRDAASRGLTIGALTNDGPLETKPTEPSNRRLCTWSVAPLGREEYPINCVDYDGARAFCIFEGGDLPTESQFEYVASAAGRSTESIYAWGSDTLLGCDDVVFGREGGDPCLGFGPLPVTEGANDVVPAVNVRGLAGGMTEITLDEFAALGASCWRAASLEVPSCTSTAGLENTARGGNWFSTPKDLLAATRDSLPRRATASVVGFRCVMRGT